ncbi:uncharacterized protein A4U43_C02F13750 [Asparagus officinalis]|uniref:Uncharacterized protein n=1 Tax=Asparagus officinalis TaxID=4686 RepID=A0A5P1FIX7_ASPOF|nr:uncharacterized protein A4U43_C02F13750 [Asparagus officinalis]
MQWNQEGGERVNDVAIGQRVGERVNRQYYLILDLDEGVKDHGLVVIEVNGVTLDLRLRGGARVPSVDREGFEALGFRYLFIAFNLFW